MRASSPFVASFFASVPDWGVTSTRISLPWRKYRERRSAGILLAGTAASCRRNRGRQDGAGPATWKVALRPSAKKMLGQVTPLDRPLPPGEGWGEGLPATPESLVSSQPLSGGGGWTGAKGQMRRQKLSLEATSRDSRSQSLTRNAKTRRKPMYVLETFASSREL